MTLALIAVLLLNVPFRTGREKRLGVLMNVKVLQGKHSVTVVLVPNNATMKVSISM